MATVATERARPVLLRSRTAIAAAVVAAVAVDVFAWGRAPGFGLAAAGVIVVAAIWSIAESRTVLAWPQRTLWAAAVFFASVPAWRASETLVTMSVLVVLVCSGVAVSSNRTRDLGSWTIASFVGAAFEYGQAVVEPFRAAPGELPLTGPARHRLSPLWAAIRGSVVAFVVVVFFGSLLGSADPIFGSLIADALDIDLSIDRLIRSGFVLVTVTWLVLGLGRRALGSDDPHVAATRTSRARTEATIVLGALDALFLAFLVVQFRYLFDGSVARIDLGYAEYARRGFFELVTVAAAVVCLVLLVDWVVARRVRRIDLLSGALILQTFVVLASALVRMRAYTDAFGLSELRLYTTVFMFWTAIVLATLVVTVLRGHRSRFALTAFVSGLVMAALLVIGAPDARIAEVNIARAVAGAELDVDYLIQLGPGAIPSLVEAGQRLPGDEFSRVADRLAPAKAALAVRAADLGWRSWSLDHARAAASLAGLD